MGECGVLRHPLQSVAAAGGRERHKKSLFFNDEPGGGGVDVGSEQRWGGDIGRTDQVEGADKRSDLREPCNLVVLE